MREFPILFSGQMVRAIMSGAKTQTRRVIKNLTPPDRYWLDGPDPDGFFRGEQDGGCNEHGAWCYKIKERCPYGQPGDQLWVRESWGIVHDHHLDVAEAQQVEDARNGMPWAGVVYRADSIGAYASAHLKRWRPSIHMPRWASRITLEVTGVRVERVQDIQERDASAEGVTVTVRENGALAPFRELWNFINAKNGFGWGENPWVWAIEFKRLEARR